MSNLKNTVNKVIFKIFIGFLLLSFVFFGISSFFLGDSGSWIAKVNGKKITQRHLQQAMQIDKNSLMQANPNNERAREYINSQRFLVDVLKKLINREIAANLTGKFNIEASRRLIMESIASDPTFFKDGKFDHQFFSYYLAQNGLNEKEYVKLIQSEIVNAIISNSISMTSPIDLKITSDLANLKNQKRIADIVTISMRNIGKIKAPSKEDLEKIYQENQANFSTEEKRKTSYIVFNKANLIQKISISEKELQKFYNANKEDFRQEDKKSFYHIVFKDEGKAQEFSESLKNSKNKIQKFINLAKKEGKNLDAIKIKNVSKSDMLPQLSEQAFKLQKNEASKVLKSDLGNHIFLALNQNSEQYLSYEKAKKSIKKQLLSKKTQESLREKLTNIENFLIASNSLEETAKKFNLGKVRKTLALSRNSNSIKLKNYTANSFSMKEKQTSQIFSSENNFYALKVDEIIKPAIKPLKSVKNEVKKTYYQQQKLLKLKELTKKVAAEIQANPKNIRKIAYKYKLKFENNKVEKLTSLINFQGRKIPFTSKFSEDLFSLNVGKATSYHAAKSNEYKVAVLEKIIQNKASKKELQEYRKNLATTYRNEFIIEFNQYLQNELNIKINENFLNSLEQK